ncbi:MAG: entericidin A/B family lipoprotein [Phenylobacterium sp.]|jgi:predicted small secreted protein|nr:entericidin A/B family lipoprotein [Phenylobacterium sp.]MBW0149717.1 entericidin A/B family lipoprotein [Phenylobacterium sp.]MDP1642826.1 entericidin A/B family lipoprotein [Phenylobacterium sp.]MDP3116403.1 entericidin A/B family lipoprotein [Phenylobacterium sp.]MDZ4317969.1 entericidin A/B family lipoprotein [Phenylobacterium sp.]
MSKVLIMAAVAAALLVAGCNTVAGVGRDMQAAGTAVKNTAEDVRR